MRTKNILLVIGILIVLGLFIRPSITGFAVQDRFLISNVKVSADEFSEEIRVEQFDEYETEFRDALYYFTVGVDEDQEMNYIEIEFMVDSSQGEDIGLYFYDNEWKELEIEFVRREGRYNYYKAKSEKFGLFTVGLKERVVKAIARNDVLLFGLLPILIILLLFSALSYGFVRLVQRFSYRFYLVLKKGFVGLVKFGLSFGIVIMILDLISVNEQGSVSGMSLIYYAVIPMVVLSLLSDVILNLLLWLHRVILGNRVYRFVRNSFWLFGFSFIFVISLFFRFIPEGEGSLSGYDVLLFGLLPIILITSVFVFVFYGFYKLTKRVFVHE